MQHASRGSDRSGKRRRRRALVVASALGVGLVAAAPASADLVDFDPLAPLMGFDVFTAGDATILGNENEGTHAVGGNLIALPGAVYNVGNSGTGGYTAAGDPVPTGLYVRGRAVFPGGITRVTAGQYARILDVSGASVSSAGGITTVESSTVGVPGAVEIQTAQPPASVSAVPSNAVDFEGAFATLRDNATELATCEPNLTLQQANGDPLEWPASGTVTGYLELRLGETNVLSLTSAQLRSLDGLTFRNGLPDGTTLLVNVTDWTTGSWTVPNFAGIGRTEAGRIVWNFGAATEIVLAPGSATLEGTVYAPSAQVSLLTGSNVEGHIASAGLSHTGGGEIHDSPSLPLISCTTPETPEPPLPPQPPVFPPTPVVPPVTVVPPPTVPTDTDDEPAPEFTLSKRASRTRLTAGDTLRYTLTVRNRGDLTALRARICDDLPARLSLVNRGGGTLTRGQRLCWRVARIASGQTVRRTFTARIDRDARRGITIVNHATVNTEQVTGVDARARRTVRVVRAAATRPTVSKVTG